MSATVQEVFGIRGPGPGRSDPDDTFLINDRLVGVEIEIEGYNDRASDDTRKLRDYWDITNDGSLRGPAVELVLSRPLWGRRLKEAIDVAYNWINKHRLHPSNRTALHLHVDVRDFTLQQVINSMGAYLAFEECIFERYADDRKNNLFCVALNRADGHMRELGLVQRMIGMEANERILRPLCAQFTDRTLRYSAVNLSSLAELGTLEFRQLETPTDKETVYEWINLITSLVVRSKDIDLHNLIEQSSILDPDEFGFDVLGQSAKYLIGTPSWNAHDLVRSVRKAQDILVYSAGGDVEEEVDKPEESSLYKYFSKE